MHLLATNFKTLKALIYKDLVNYSPPPFYPPYACIIFDNRFCIKYAFRKCQQLSGFSFSRVRIFITHYLYNTHVKIFKYLISENCCKLLELWPPKLNF